MSYEYSPVEKPKVEWATVILAVWGLVIVIAIFYLFIWRPLSDISGRTNDLLDNSQNNNQGIAVGEPNPNGYDCVNDSYSCNNFTSQAEAQTAFDSCFTNYGDIHGLDPDGNGRACENLPQ